jgi:hypothetical protein
LLPVAAAGRKVLAAVVESFKDILELSQAPLTP